MKIFNRKKKQSINTEMSEEQAIQKTTQYINADRLYILLSIEQADMLQGISVPYIGVLPNGQTTLFIFTSLESAKKFVDLNGCEKLDGIYPIGMIEKSHLYNNLKGVCSLALHFGVNYIGFDQADESKVFGCEIRWFFQVNHIAIERVPMVLSKEEFQIATNEKNPEIQQHMNPMPVVDFSHSYDITEERANNLLRDAINGQSEKELIDTFQNKESLFENCYVMELVITQLVPQAKQNGRENDMAYFDKVIELLSLVIKDKLMDSPLYAIKKSGSDKIYIHGDAIFLLYTDRFKYMCDNHYIKLKDLREFRKLIEKNGVSRVAVTDGPHSVAVIDAKIFKNNGAARR